LAHDDSPNSPPGWWHNWRQEIKITPPTGH
jgi:hypothetical protein